jgi:hypothetical protein
LRAITAPPLLKYWPLFVCTPTAAMVAPFQLQQKRHILRVWSRKSRWIEVMRPVPAITPQLASEAGDACTNLRASRAHLHNLVINSPRTRSMQSLVKWLMLPAVDQIPKQGYQVHRLGLKRLCRDQWLLGSEAPNLTKGLDAATPILQLNASHLHAACGMLKMQQGGRETTTQAWQAHGRLLRRDLRRAAALFEWHGR